MRAAIGGGPPSGEGRAAFGGGPPSADVFPSLITTSNLQESEPSRMRTETNVWTRTEMSMLRINDKITMFSPFIKVLFTWTEMSMLRIDDKIAMFSPLI